MTVGMLRSHDQLTLMMNGRRVDNCYATGASKINFQQILEIWKVENVCVCVAVLWCCGMWRWGQLFSALFVLVCSIVAVGKDPTTWNGGWYYKPLVIPAFEDMDSWYCGIHRRIQLVRTTLLIWESCGTKVGMCKKAHSRLFIPYLQDLTSISCWWFGTFFIFPYIGNNHPNWLIFFRGIQTTNQIWTSSDLISCCVDVSDRSYHKSRNMALHPDTPRIHWTAATTITEEQPIAVCYRWESVHTNHICTVRSG